MMKAFMGMALVACAGSMAMADVYTDSANDIADGINNAGGTMDILSAEVTSDATSITFKITVNGDTAATDWVKYMVAINSKPGGDTTGNGWGRPIIQSTGMDIWLGSWIDSGNGIENRQWDGAAWNLTSASYLANPNVSVIKSGNMVTINATLAGLGLAFGDVIRFDIVSSGGGGTDGAIDSLANPTFQVFDWGQPSDVGNLVFTIPSPSAAVLAGLAGLGLAGRRRR